MSKRLLSDAYVSEFCRELSATVRSGLPISDGIYMLFEDDENNVSDKELLGELYKETEKGGTLAEAVKKTGRFPKYAEDMIEIGEKTGRLDSVLSELSSYYTRQDEIGRSIRSAITFPSVLLVILIVIIVVLLTQIMPIFNDVFKQLGVSMSPVAQFLYDAGGLISAYAVGIIALCAIVALIVLILRKNAKTKGKLSSIFKNGKIHRQISSARFASAMALALSSGMDIDESLVMSKKICDNTMNEKIDGCVALMKKGKSFDKAVKEMNIFNSMNCRRLIISFKTGSTDKAMTAIAEDSEIRLNEAIDSKISKVEPTLVAIMSILVGVILFSVMLPMMSIITSV